MWRRASSRWLICLAAAAGLSIEARPRSPAPEESNPFEFLAPWVIVTPDDRARLDREEVVTRTLSGRDGQLAVFVATRLNAPPDALVAWTRAIAELKRSRFVLAIGRFSDPPSPSDLEGLELDERELDAIRRCRPGACGMKLSAGEIESLTATVAGSGAGWQDAVQREFRRLLAARVLRYRAGGLTSLAPPADRKNQSTPDQALAAIVEQSPYLKKLPDVTRWLEEYPHADSGVESFFYWSKEHYGQGKPVIALIHVGIVRPPPDQRVPAVLVAGKQIFATHYFEGGLGLTMIVRDTTNGMPYLAYVNRSQVDVLRGFLGRIVRGVLEDRVERQAPLIVRELRARLESGSPPDEASDPFAARRSGAR